MKNADSHDVVRCVFDALKERKAVFSSAESCTGGNIAHQITLIPGSSDVFVGTVVSYATRVKTDILGVPAETIEKEGVVSLATAEAMAQGVRRLLATDYAVATTGVAGPSGEDRSKFHDPVPKEKKKPRTTRSRLSRTTMRVERQDGFKKVFVRRRPHRKYKSRHHRGLQDAFGLH